MQGVAFGYLNKMFKATFKVTGLGLARWTFTVGPTPKPRHHPLSPLTNNPHN